VLQLYIQKGANTNCLSDILSISLNLSGYFPLVTWSGDEPQQNFKIFAELLMQDDLLNCVILFE
jgi:hypothetical protein